MALQVKAIKPAYVYSFRRRSPTDRYWELVRSELVLASESDSKEMHIYYFSGMSKDTALYRARRICEKRGDCYTLRVYRADGTVQTEIPKEKL